MIALHAIAPLLPDIWITAEGRVVPIQDMSDEHISNVLRRFYPPREWMNPNRQQMAEAVFQERQRRRQENRWMTTPAPS